MPAEPTLTEVIEQLLAKQEDEIFLLKTRIETLRIIAHRCLNSMEHCYKKLGASDAESEENIRVIRERIDEV